MSNEVRNLLNPSEQFCPNCTDELRAEMVCSRCQKNLLDCSGTVYECSVCAKRYCENCWSDLEGQERFTGKITTWFKGRNYGFIRSRKLGNEVFIHAEDVDFEPQKGMKVSFEVTKTPKGLRARRIRQP